MAIFKNVVPILLKFPANNGGDSVLPIRLREGEDDVVSVINTHLKTLCEKYRALTFINTVDNGLFSDRIKKRKTMYVRDDVHFNNIGVRRMCKHLKFISHNGLP